MAKALLIKSYTQKTGSQGVWNTLDDAVSYVQGINTGKLLENMTADKINALISGVPSPWARAKLFKFAFDTITHPDPNIEEAGLTQFYQILVGEWKGLVAVLALFGDRIRISDPIYMPLNGDDYNIVSAFGRMLFSDKDLWSNQEALASSPDAQPYIQLIYYNDTLIGGTSPMTAFFTGVDYSNLSGDTTDIPWYRNGVFEDPTKYLDPSSLQKVYLFVKNMNSNAASFEKMLNSQRNGNPKLSIDGFKNLSRGWESELKKKGGNTLSERGPIAQYDNLQCPFSILLKSEVPVYLKPDFTFSYSDGEGYKQVGDIQGLLSSERFVVGWTEEKDTNPKLSDSVMHYLTVKDIRDGSCSYFTLPLSERGLEIFQNKLGGLLGQRNDGNAKLSAEITDAGKLAVTMEVEIDGEWTKLNKREYTISWQVIPAKVIMWPNFVSENWNKYYVYSEFTNEAKQKFVPMFKAAGQLIKTIDGEILTADYGPRAGETKQVEVKQLVKYQSGIDESLPKYNISEFDKPIFGLVATAKDGGKDYRAGYLVLRSDKVKDLSSVDMKSNAIIGFDFGSNNTCVFFNADNRGPEPIKFENYRAVMVGRENMDMRSLATNDELLFFSNYPSLDGQVKSWLHEHDSRFNPYSQSDEISGGVPVYRPNVQVREMTEYVITTQAGTMHYNMKWLDDDKGLMKKRAFLKTVWVQACAYLYTHQVRPTQIGWSYPGSMMESDRNILEQTFNMLCSLTPISGKKPTLLPTLTTESEAVCSFALGQKYALGTNNIMLGIDVGGSTSDILLLAKGHDNSDTLMRESSVRMAAGIFFGAVTRSDEFRKALVTFHESGKVKNLHVENIQEILSSKEKAPYYLNNIFDQLKTSDEYEALYTSLSERAKRVFTIPAYVTGVLLFYSGMMIGRAIKDNQLSSVQNVDIFSFGKGGRLFHWLSSATAPRVVNQYYADCVNAGIACVSENLHLIVTYDNSTSEFNKSEVARGLCDMKMLNKAPQAADCDICGERNVQYTDGQGTRIINVDEELSGDYFANSMNNFNFGRAENLEKFMQIFFDFVSTKTDLCKDAENLLSDAISSLPNHFKTNITNHDTEYKKALRNNSDGFHYHQPIIIAEALYLQNVLIEKVF